MDLDAVKEDGLKFLSVLKLGVEGLDVASNDSRYRQAGKVLAEFELLEDAAYEAAPALAEPNLEPPFGAELLLRHRGNLAAVVADDRFEDHVTAALGLSSYERAVHDEDGARYEWVDPADSDEARSRIRETAAWIRQTLEAQLGEKISARLHEIVPPVDREDIPGQVTQVRQSFDTISDVPLRTWINVSGIPYELATSPYDVAMPFMDVQLLSRAPSPFAGTTLIHIGYSGASTDWLVVPDEQPITRAEEDVDTVAFTSVDPPRLEAVDLLDPAGPPGSHLLLTGNGRYLTGSTANQPMTAFGRIIEQRPAAGDELLVTIDTDLGRAELYVDPRVEQANARMWMPPTPSAITASDAGAEMREGDIGSGWDTTEDTDWVPVHAQPRAGTLVSWNDGEKPEDVFRAAYIATERWNGWAKPYFDQDECLRLAARQTTDGERTQYEYDAGRNIWQEVNVEEDYRADCKTRVVDGQLCHELGSGFTWYEVKLPEDDDIEEGLNFAVTSRTEPWVPADHVIAPVDPPAGRMDAVELDKLPPGAVLHAVHTPAVAWIKTSEQTWANYSNWPAPPTGPDTLVRITNGDLMRGTTQFESYPPGPAGPTPQMPSSPGPAKERQVFGVEYLKAGSVIINDAGDRARIDRVMRNGDEFHIRLTAQDGTAGKLTVNAGKQFQGHLPQETTATSNPVADVEPAPTVLPDTSGPGLF